MPFTPQYEVGEDDEHLYLRNYRESCLLPYGEGEHEVLIE